MLPENLRICEISVKKLEDLFIIYKYIARLHPLTDAALRGLCTFETLTLAWTR